VGTATEVYDFLRLLWARAGTAFCRKCGHPVVKDTAAQAAGRIGQLGEARVRVTFPVPESARVTHAALVENLRALGFLRVEVDGREYHLDELPANADLTAGREVLVVVDRLAAGDAARLGGGGGARIRRRRGICLVLHEAGRFRFTERLACSVCDTRPSPDTAAFSFKRREEPVAAATASARSWNTTSRWWCRIRVAVCSKGRSILDQALRRQTQAAAGARAS
jgi:excinuclease ABC subunit A